MAPTSHPSEVTRDERIKTATIIFVLGGPGSGKGTQCAKLVADYGFKHLSAGDLLRAEQERPDSQDGKLISEYIKDGKIVPMRITIRLLQKEIDSTMQGGESRFLIDGFPRKMDQAEEFERTVCPSSFTLFFDCPEETMRERLLDRGKTSGRSDDNEESIKKRFVTFQQTSMPVVAHFEKEGKVVKVSSVPGVDEVYKAVRTEFEKRGLMMKGNKKDEKADKEKDGKVDGKKKDKEEK
jgi:UMP-CMP kinase